MRRKSGSASIVPSHQALWWEVRWASSPSSWALGLLGVGCISGGTWGVAGAYGTLQEELHLLELSPPSQGAKLDGGGGWGRYKEGPPAHWECSPGLGGPGKLAPVPRVPACSELLSAVPPPTPGGLGVPAQLTIPLPRAQQTHSLLP